MAGKASKDDSKGGGIMPVVLAAIATLVLGFGGGFGISSVVAPQAASDGEVAPAPVAGLETAKPGSTEHGKGDEQKTSGEGSEEMAAQNSTDDEEQPVSIDPADIAFAAFPPVVTNIKEPSGVWLRLEGGITFAKSGEKKVEVLTAEVAQQVLHYARTLKMTDISSPDGLRFIQEDLNVISRASSEGQIQNVLITGLILE